MLCDASMICHEVTVFITFRPPHSFATPYCLLPLYPRDPTPGAAYPLF